MPVFIIRFLFTIILLGALSFPAAAKNIEVESKNIIFVGDVSEEGARRIVGNMEIYRETILALMDKESKPDIAKLKIYGLENTKAVGKFVGGKGISGLYTQGLDGPIFITTTKGNFEGDKWSSQVALHEYGHHILRSLSSESFPRWYDEGFANYLSTFSTKDGVITIGSPNVEHAKSLTEDRWMTAKTVIGSVHHYPKRGWISQFYGQSWLYVHYMQNNPELLAKLPLYLANLDAGQKAHPAFENAFGMSAKEYHKLARAYWRENNFPVMQFNVGDSLNKVKMNVRELSDAETELYFLEGQRIFMSKSKASSLAKKYAVLYEALGARTDILTGQAHCAMALEKFDEALKFAHQAIEVAPKDVDALRMLGDVRFHALMSSQFKDLKKHDPRFIPESEAFNQTVSAFENTLAVKPYDYTAISHLVQLYGLSDVVIPQTVKQATDKYTRFYLKPHQVGQTLHVANIYMRAGDKPKACDYYLSARQRVDGYDKKKINSDFAQAQAFEKKYPGLCKIDS